VVGEKILDPLRRARDSLRFELAAQLYGVEPRMLDGRHEYGDRLGVIRQFGAAGPVLPHLALLSIVRLVSAKIDKTPLIFFPPQRRVFTKQRQEPVGLHSQ